jgi:hypothetical protein
MTLHQWNSLKLGDVLSGIGTMAGFGQVTIAGEVDEHGRIPVSCGDAGRTLIRQHTCWRIDLRAKRPARKRKYEFIDEQGTAHAIKPPKEKTWQDAQAIARRLVRKCKDVSKKGCANPQWFEVAGLISAAFNLK